MRLLNLTPRGVALIMVAAAGLAAAPPFSVEGRLAGEANQVSILDSQGVENPAGTVEQCLPTETRAAGRLVLTAKKDSELKFTCDETSSISPAGDPEFTKVYLYKGEEPGNCETTKNETLAAQVGGASLTQQTVNVSSRVSKSAFYLFRYETEPDEDKHLCYTCNKASGSGSLESSSTGSVTPTSEVACTVFIKVPKKNDTPTTDSSTATPGSTSGSRVMQAAAATAAGGLLAAMLLV